MKPFEIYTNRTRKCWSIRHDGLVIAHADALELVDCRLIVNQAGRAYCLAKRKRNVHAWIEAQTIFAAEGLRIVAWADQEQASRLLSGVRSPVRLPTEARTIGEVEYSPFGAAAFVDAQGRSVEEASVVTCTYVNFRGIPPRFKVVLESR